VLFRHLPEMRATDRRTNQFRAARFDDKVHNLAFRLPSEGILDREAAVHKHRQQCLKPVQNSRVRRARCLTADNLGAYRQVHAEHTVLVKANIGFANHVGDRRAQRNE